MYSNVSFPNVYHCVCIFLLVHMAGCYLNFLIHFILVPLPIISDFGTNTKKV